jgi:hypothetical protein
LQHLAQSSAVLQHLAQPSASLQHFSQASDFVHLLLQQLSLPAVAQPAATSIPTATSATMMFVFICFTFPLIVDCFVFPA